MRDEVEIIRPASGGSVFDPTTGEYTEPADADVYSGKCRVQIGDGLTAQDAEAGGQVLTVQRLMLQIPVSVVGVHIGDVATITAVHPDGDPDLVGRVFRIDSTFAKSQATARRLQVSEVS